MLGVSIIITDTMAQCDATEKINSCVPNLPSGFSFLKGYEVNQGIGSNEVKYSYVFAKDTQYVLNICTEGNDAEGVVITLFDYSKRKLASSKIDGQYVSAVMFNCMSSGIYYITYTFEQSTAFCGASVLGFRR